MPLWICFDNRRSFIIWLLGNLVLISQPFKHMHLYIHTSCPIEDNEIVHKHRSKRDVSGFSGLDLKVGKMMIKSFLIIILWFLFSFLLRPYVHSLCCSPLSYPLVFNIKSLCCSFAYLFLYNGFLLTFNPLSCISPIPFSFPPHY